MDRRCRVLFVTAAQMLLDLAAQDSARALDRRLKHYARVGCLIVDELGYLSYDNRNGDLLYQALSLRYEKKSLVLTTNLPFSEWPTIFPSATSATALIDRIIHHADVIELEGDSFRRREAEAHGKKPGLSDDRRSKFQRFHALANIFQQPARWAESERSP